MVSLQDVPHCVTVFSHLRSFCAFPLSRAVYCLEYIALGWVRGQHVECLACVLPWLGSLAYSSVSDARSDPMTLGYDLPHEKMNKNVLYPPISACPNPFYSLGAVSIKCIVTSIEKKNPTVICSRMASFPVWVCHFS